MTTGRRLLAALVAVSTVAAVCGCRRDTGPNGPLAVPAANTVRVLAGSPSPITPDHARWTWSILGDRNWTQPGAAGTQLTLGGSYPLNDVHRLHGCNTWNCDLSLDRDPTQLDQASWTLVLHGSNGMTARSTGTLSLSGGDLSGVVSSAQDQNVTADLPAPIRLARLGDHDITLTVSK